MAPLSESSKLLNSQYRLDPYDDSFGLDLPAKPWKKVALAIGLLIFGSVLLFTGVGLYTTGQPNGIPLMVVGSFAFIPGSYFTRVAYLAWKGYRGYSIASIPGL